MDWRLHHRLARSLALRWVLSVILTAGLGIGALLFVTEQEMKYQVGAQAEAVHHLAARRLAQQADAGTLLVQERLHGLFRGLEQGVGAVAALRSTQSAIRSRNDVWMAEEIGAKLRQVGFTGAIIVDDKLRVIGADQSGASLLFSNDTLQVHDLKEILRQQVANAERSNPGTYRFSGVIDPSLAAILLTHGDGRYGLVLGVPVFDDFGEPMAIILAYRLLRMSEPVLEDFARITGANVALMFGDRTISMTGSALDKIQLGTPDSAGLYHLPDLNVVARCRKVNAPLSICVMEPEAAISKLSGQIMAIGHAQFERTRTTLYSIGLFALMLMLLVLFMLGRRLARPLEEIAASVDQVAHGEWKVEVPHAAREDEVGRIARALVQLQISLAERDRMREEMTRINEINSRRLVLDTAVGRFEDRMAVVMKGISATVHALGETNEMLDEAARRAGTEAERIRTASLATASRTSSVTMTTEALASTMRQIGERVRRTSSVVHRSETHAQQAEAQIDVASVAAVEVESALAALQGLVADMGTLGLRGSLQAMQAGEAGASFAPMASAVTELSARAAQSAQALEREVQRLAAANDHASEAISEARGVLGDALRETSEITVALTEQDAAAREIVEGMTNAAQVLGTLAEAVDQLHANMTSAHEASNEFFVAARRMAEDARAIDGSVRNFVREVAA